MPYLGWVQRFLLLGCLLCSTLLQARPVSLEVVQEFGSDPYGKMVQVGDYVIVAGASFNANLRSYQMTGLFDILQKRDGQLTLIKQSELRKLLPDAFEPEVYDIMAVNGYVYLLVKGFYPTSNAIVTLQLEHGELKVKHVTFTNNHWYSINSRLYSNGNNIFVTYRYENGQQSTASLMLESFQLQPDGTPRFVATKNIAKLSPPYFRWSFEWPQQYYYASVHQQRMLLMINQTAGQSSNSDSGVELYEAQLVADGAVTQLQQVNLLPGDILRNYIAQDDQYIYIVNGSGQLEVRRLENNVLTRVSVSDVELGLPLSMQRRGNQLHVVTQTEGVKNFTISADGHLRYHANTAKSSSWSNPLIGGSVLTDNTLYITNDKFGLAAIPFDGDNKPAYNGSLQFPPHTQVFNQGSTSFGISSIGSTVINPARENTQVWSLNPALNKYELSVSAHPTGKNYDHRSPLVVNGNRLLTIEGNELVSYNGKALPDLAERKVLQTLASGHRIHALPAGYLVSSANQHDYFDAQDRLQWTLTGADLFGPAEQKYRTSSNETVSGEWLFTALESTNVGSKIRVYQPGSPAPTAAVAELLIPNASIKSRLSIQNNTLAVYLNVWPAGASFGTDMLNFYDISDIKQIKLLSSFDLKFSPATFQVASQWLGNYFIVMGDYIACIFDLTNPATPLLVAKQYSLSSNGQTYSTGNELFNIPYNHVGHFQQLRLNYAPTAKDLTLQVVQNSVLQHQLQGTDPENDELTFAVAKAPLNGSLTITDGKFLQYQPKVGFAGKDTASLRVQDKLGGFSVFSLTVEVIATNQAPQVKKLTLTTSQNQSVTAHLDASDPDGDALSYQIVTAATNGTADISAQGQIQFRPRRGFIGQDAFTVRVSDGQLTVDAVVDVEVDAGWSWFD